jgi:ABC-type xylose transport system permease subunit
MNAVTAPPVRPTRASWRPGRPRLPSVGRFSAVYLWVVFLVLFGALQFRLFLTVSTFQVVFSQGAVTAVLALAFLMPLTTDTYDLSIGEVMSLTIVVINWLTLHTSLPIGVIAVMAVAGCALIGAVSGFVVVKLRVNSLIATLGMSEVLSAFQLYISQNHQVAGRFSSLFVTVGNGTVFGVPYLDLYMIVIAGALWFVLEQTPLGRRMFAGRGHVYRAGRRLHRRHRPGLPVPGARRRVLRRIAALAAAQRMGDADRLLRPGLRRPGPHAAVRRGHVLGQPAVPGRRAHRRRGHRQQPGRHRRRR